MCGHYVTGICERKMKRTRLWKCLLAQAIISLSTPSPSTAIINFRNQKDRSNLYVRLLCTLQYSNCNLLIYPTSYAENVNSPSTAIINLCRKGKLQLRRNLLIRRQKKKNLPFQLSLAFTSIQLLYANKIKYGLGILSSNAFLKSSEAH